MFYRAENEKKGLEYKSLQLYSTTCIQINEFNFYLLFDSISKPFGTTYYRLLSGCKHPIAILNCPKLVPMRTPYRTPAYRMQYELCFPRHLQDKLIKNVGFINEYNYDFSAT